MKDRLTVVWLALVATGAIWALRSPPPPTAALAAHALPQNTLLLPGPFTPRRFELHYVGTAGGLPEGVAVTAADLVAEPVLPKRGGDVVLLQQPIDWAEVGAGLNAGSDAQLCSADKSLVAAKLLAVRCDPATRKCSGTVSVKPTGTGRPAWLDTAAPLRVAAACSTP